MDQATHYRLVFAKRILLHRAPSALERSGLTNLSEGNRVIVDLAQGRKGQEAARVRLA
jgi:cold shock CspA family protein